VIGHIYYDKRQAHQTPILRGGLTFYRQGFGSFPAGLAASRNCDLCSTPVFLLVLFKREARRVADVSSLSQKPSDAIVLLFCGLAA
jgi:hypothetical protein